MFLKLVILMILFVEAKESKLTSHSYDDWQARVMELNQIKPKNLEEAKQLARKYLTDPSLLVRSKAAEILGNQLQKEDVPMLKKILQSDQSRHRGRWLFIGPQVALILWKNGYLTKEELEAMDLREVIQ